MEQTHFTNDFTINIQFEAKDVIPCAARNTHIEYCERLGMSVTILWPDFPCSLPHCVLIWPYEICYQGHVQVLQHGNYHFFIPIFFLYVFRNFLFKVEVYLVTDFLVHLLGYMVLGRFL